MSDCGGFGQCGKPNPRKDKTGAEILDPKKRVIAKVKVCRHCGKHYLHIIELNRRERG